MSTIPPGVRRAFRLPDSRSQLARELDDEVRFHIEQRVADLVARGMSPADAQADALRRFGDGDDLRDYCESLEAARMRRVHINEWVASLIQDLQFAWRQARRSPGFTFVVVLTLALGLGAATSIFTVVDSVLLRALPYPDAERIVQIWEVGSDGQRMQVADPNFADFRGLSHSFSGIAEVAGGGVVTVSGADQPVRVPVAIVSREFFSVLGVQPEIGRLFAEDELHPGGPAAVVISHAFWQQNLGGRHAVLDRQLHSGGTSFTIVGVMPAVLDFPVGVAVWIARERDEPLPSRTAHNWRVVARLRPGVTRENAQSEVSDIARKLKRQLGEMTTMSDAAVVTLREELVGNVRRTLLLILGAAAVLLLIACANVANLLIARMASRRGEIAVRLALGAARARLVQQFLVEALVLSVIAAAAGVALAYGGVQALTSLQPRGLPRAGDIHIDWIVLLFAFAASTLVAVGLGVSSAWRGTRANLRDELSQAQRTLSGSGSHHRLRSTLVVVQVALTLMLLVGAGLLGRSFERLLAVDPGFRTDSAVVLDIAAEMGSPAERIAFYDELSARIRALPGVTSVGGTNAMPLTPLSLGDGTFIVMSRPDEVRNMETFERASKDPARTGEAEFRVVGPGYFSTMRIPVVQGRAFTEGDARTAPHVAVVSASLAKGRWAAGNPIGKLIQFGNMDGDLTAFTVVGVVGDVRESSLASSPRPTLYASYQQRPAVTSRFNLVIAHRGVPAPIIAAAQRIVREMRPDVPPRFRTVEQIVSRSVADRRFVLLLVGVFSGVALLLASLGVYSVISYLVAQRTREISIRVALGAQRHDVTRLVLSQGTTLALGGILIGTAASIAASRLIRGVLYGVSPTDPGAFAAVIALLIGMALVATYVPARHAARVAPMDVLRSG
jgi:predicted permease